MIELCANCKRKKLFDDEGGYTLKDAEKDFLHLTKDLTEQVWLCCWNCYEQYRATITAKKESEKK